MDGYIRVNTDDKGKIIDIWDEWYKDRELKSYMWDCGIDCYLDDYTFTPNSLILITFEHKSEITYSYMNGKEYNDWLEIKDEMVLIENYNHEDLYDDKCDLGCIEDCPTIDAVPMVRGEWKPIFKGADTCECSVCKSEGFSDSDYGFIATPYCPNCGAEMEEHHEAD